MSRRIGVWGVCDTGGLTATLRTLLTDDTVQPLVQPSNSEEKLAWLEALPENFDVLISPVSRALPDSLLAHENKRLRILRYPVTVFKAFHPDLRYVGSVSGGSLITPAYNSAICIWSYARGLSVDQTTALFRTEVFQSLGYFDLWDNSVEHLRGEYSKCDLDFTSFFLKIKRLGAFMHSFDHPTARTIVALGKCIAQKLGAPNSILDVPVDVPDALAQLNWPIYPEIGENFGLQTAYRWTPEGDQIRPMDLKSYVSVVYGKYAAIGVRADDIFYDGSAMFDALLPPMVA